MFNHVFMVGSRHIPSTDGMGVVTKVVSFALIALPVKLTVISCPLLLVTAVGDPDGSSTEVLLNLFPEHSLSPSPSPSPSLYLSLSLFPISLSSLSLSLSLSLPLPVPLQT